MKYYMFHIFGLLTSIQNLKNNIPVTADLGLLKKKHFSAGV